MPALTIGVVSLKVRVMDVENMIWILASMEDDRRLGPVGDLVGNAKAVLI
jgi:hypothetical protein